VTRSPERPTSSETTGLVSAGNAVGDLIGLLRGGIGSGRPLTTEAGLPRVPALPAGEMVRTEENVDRPASWPAPVRSLIRSTRWRDGTSAGDAGWDGYPVEHEIVAEVPAEAAELADRLLAQYRQLCAPMARTDLAYLLGRLRLSVVKKHDEEFDWKTILDVWLDDLSQYPADIVVWALGYWHRNEKWWPIWCEFLPLLERRTEQRKAVMDALQTIIARGRASRQEAAE
jgi:hypothetical protein